MKLIRLISNPGLETRLGGGLGALASLLLVALPASAQAGFTYMINDSALTITAYTGPSGDVTIPEAINGMPVVGLGDFAFEGNSSLTGVSVPKTVTNIGTWAFYMCTNLNGITVDAQNTIYTSADGVLFDKNQTRLIQYPGGRGGNYTVPGTVTRILDNAFSWSANLASVAVPDSVTTMGSAAFSDCPNLASVTLGNGITSIGDWAFSGCSKLTSVTMSGRVTAIGDWAFSGCASLTSIAIPSSVAAIGHHAFSGCASLTSLKLPASLTSVAFLMFSGCTSLVSVTVPAGVTNIQDYAWYDCTSLKSVYFAGNAPAPGLDIFHNATSATVYYMPGTTGWGPTLGGQPTALWNPRLEAVDPGFGVPANRYEFNIKWAKGRVVVVEAATDLATPAWVPMATNTLPSDTSYFSDQDWAKYPKRVYRVRGL